MIQEINEWDVSKIIPGYDHLLEVPDYTSKDLSDNTQGYGLTGKFDIDVILRLLHYTNTKSIFEFGTWFGRTTRILSLHCDNVYTIDIDRDSIDISRLPEIQLKELSPREWIGDCYRNSPNLNGIHQFYGDSTDINIINNFRSIVGKVDACFVDANHNYCPVLCDSWTAKSITKPGGIMIWHDVRNGSLELGVDAALEALPFTIYHILNTWVGFYINV